MCIVLVVSIPADGLAPEGGTSVGGADLYISRPATARASAGTVLMAEFESRDWSSKKAVRQTVGTSH